MGLKDEISQNSEEFKNLCKIHRVKYIFAFGSSISDDFNPESSDIDLLIEIDDPDPIGRGEKLLSVWDLLEKFFKRKVDLLTESSIHNPYLRKSIDATKILIYDGKGQKVFV